jgi:peptide/nickel transport system permease protein
MAQQHQAAVAQVPGLRARPSITTRMVRLARKQPLGAVAAFLILWFLLVAALADVIAPYSPYESFTGHRLENPSWQFWFGTDQFSRDNFSRIVYGSRISLVVGISSVILGTLVGSLLGLISGWWEGRFDLIFQRLMDGMMAFPQIILALVVVGVLGPSIINVIIAIGIGGIPRTNRVVRGSVLGEKPKPYIEAARCIGASNWRILFMHLVPNVTAPVIIIASVTLGSAIIAEASLSFLGLGVPPPEPSWGGMIARDVRKFLLVQPWMAVWPGLALSLVVLGWNMLGDSLRDIWDPRLRGR